MEPDELAVETNEERATMAPLDPRHLSLLRIRAGLFAAILIAVALALDIGPIRQTPVPQWSLPGAAALLGLLLLIVLPKRRYRAWGYAESADELRIRHGLLVRTMTLVPFGRVQHIDVAQGPLQRRLGLATLIVHTAGTHGAAVPLPGLAHGQAEAMRDRIRAKIGEEFA